MADQEQCRHCGAVVDYECNGASRCQRCGERLYGIPLVLPDGLPALEVRTSILTGFLVIDPSVRDRFLGDQHG